ncbi:hypothetical protein [Luteolibacter sp. LG18]|uniref:hypothetical protein n=1 Tax=Luteolibacter sp. LG18 TaxID=2819286 RepID=UPI002B31F451|nr:hypothetical protein llg_41990 [Luteolibacter sp. LG18]
MKPFKSAALAALVLALGGTASGQTVIRIVASNGDRVATQTAISHILASGWTFQGINGNTSSSGSLSTATGANFGAWNGTYNGNAVIIKVSYSGALAGVAAVAGNTDQRFVVSNGTGTGSVPNPLTATNLNVDYEIGKADFGFSTNFQSTSPFNGVFENVTYNPVVEEIVGVSPLGFYASPGFPTAGANITTQLAQLLYTSGSVSLAQFTGDFSADQNKIVYAIGRNTDAGQRFGAYTEIGLGTTTGVSVWQPSVTGTTTASGITYGGTVNSHALWPAETVSGIFSALGNGGFSSGALVAQNLTVTLGSDAYKGKYFDEDTQTNQFLYPNATAGYYIGYVTPGDATDRILGGNGVVPVGNRGVALKYNGVDLTSSNVQNGRYTAWLYNRILKPQSGLTGLKLTFANALRDQIKNVDAPSGGGLFNDSTFKVQRFTDGGLVVPK